MNNSKQFDKRYFFQPGSENSELFTKLYFRGFNIEEFNKRKKEFINSDFSNLNDQEIKSKIKKLITFQNPLTGQNYYNIPTWSYVCKKGTKVFRIRKINFDLKKLQSSDLKVLQDFWNPPECVINEYGRLNYPFESLLYTSQNPELAINELKIATDEYFVLITYELLADIDLTIIGLRDDLVNILNLEDLKKKALTNFFFEMFSKNFKEDNTYFYKITSNLLKYCFYIPNKGQGGWVYPSVKSEMGYNLCFKPEIARSNIILIGAEICKLDSKYNFIIQSVISDIDDNNSFTYHLIGSETQKKLYPHISLCE